MNTLIRKHWPLIAVTTIYWITILILLQSSIRINDGHFIYPLDDTYIHMAIAKNAAVHHVWGVTRHEFTSSSSAPLWTLLLAGTYLAFGVNTLAPLVLNVIFGTSVLLVSHLFVRRYITRRWVVFGLLLLALFLTPLPALTMIGMEHVLHALLTLGVVVVASVALAAGTPLSRTHSGALFVLAPLLTATRYEGLFLVLVLCLLFALRKRIGYAVLLGASAALPPLAYGLWSISQGWYFLPNPVLLKGNTPSLSWRGVVGLLGYDAIEHLSANPHLLVLLVAALAMLLLYVQRDHWHDARTFALVIFAGTALLHMQFAATGWFYRYEAYLVLLGVLVLGAGVGGLALQPSGAPVSGKRVVRYAVLALMIALAADFSRFAYRTQRALLKTPQATKNIHEQQYQMGLFVRRFYQGKTIALNDIGAVAYLADVRVLDLWGLGSLEPARCRRQNRYGTREVLDLARRHDVTIAIVYDRWFSRDGVSCLPAQWPKMGQWRIADNVTCGEDTVSFYAVRPAAGAELLENLRLFASELPADVKQHGEYMARGGD